MKLEKINEIFNNLIGAEYKMEETGKTLQNPGGNFRPNVVCVEDAFFGDSGKRSFS